MSTIFKFCFSSEAGGHLNLTLKFDRDKLSFEIYDKEAEGRFDKQDKHTTQIHFTCPANEFNFNMERN